MGFELLQRMNDRDGSTKTWNPESGNGNGVTETETEYGIRERRFQAIDLKKKYISNDNKINKQIKSKGEETAVSLEEFIPVKRLLIPLPAMNANSHGKAK